MVTALQKSANFDKRFVDFLPGGSYPEQPEYAAELYRRKYAKWLIPSGGVSVKRDRWPGVRAKADRYNGDYQSDCAFFTDVLIKNGVPADAIIGEGTSGHTRDNAFRCLRAVLPAPRWGVSGLDRRLKNGKSD